MARLKKYEHTIFASYAGYITQAIVNNFAPLLFITFASDFALTLDKITLITTLNFLIQLAVDLASTKLVDKIGYRTAAVGAHIFSALGLIGMAVLPDIFPDPYAGLLIAVAFYAIGGGLIEVIISPIVESCPTSNKEAAMSLLHSFYCWGFVSVVVISTVFFSLCGIQNWRTLAVGWAIVPAANALYFAAVPLRPIVPDGSHMPLKTLVKQKIFWLLVVIMICAGASEQAMSQWASAFSESALHISKTVGDLAGPCAFAVFMGMSRLLYGKYSERLPLKSFMIGSSILCIACYLTAVFAAIPILGLIGCALCGFSVGIFWPGTISIAAGNLGSAGTALYALLALAGDLGCSAGPSVVGFVANVFGGDLKRGLLAAIAFPLLILMGILKLKAKSKSAL